MTQPEVSAGAEMKKRSDGYFARTENAEIFIDIGLKGIVRSMGFDVNYASFGGGEGFLAKSVARYLVANERRPSTIVVDTNPDFLAVASSRGLATLHADLSKVRLSGFDLITMRSVNHHYAMPEQQRIVGNTFAALKAGGWLVSQNLSGPSERYCRLASKLSRLPALGRPEEDCDRPYIASEAEFTALMGRAGFEDIRVAGHAPMFEVGPDWCWRRFNEHRREAALAAGDDSEVRSIDERRARYFEESNGAIGAFLKDANDAEAALIRKTDESYIVTLTFPISVGRKPGGEP